MLRSPGLIAGSKTRNSGRTESESVANQSRQTAMKGLPTVFRFIGYKESDSPMRMMVLYTTNGSLACIRVMQLPYAMQAATLEKRNTSVSLIMQSQLWRREV